MYKKFLAAILACLMVLSMAACGKKTAQNDRVVFKGNSGVEKTVELGIPQTQLDPQTVYSKLSYTHQMFYGCYQLQGGNTASDKYSAEAEYFTWTQNGKELLLSKLPFKMKAGPATFAHSIHNVKEYNWMELYFMRKANDGKYYLHTVIGAYEINGMTLIFKPLDTFHVDNENNKITYSFTDAVWEYTFAFSGRNLTLSTNGISLTLTTFLNASGEEDYFYTDGYLSPGSESAHNIDRINFRNSDGDSHLTLVTTDNTWSYNSIAVLQENGLFTFTLALKENTQTYQYVYFCGGNDGIVLTDGTNTYYYCATFRDRHKANASKFLTEDHTAKLDDLTDSQLEAITEKATNLLEDLAAAYQKAGLNVTVNPQTGEIALDSAVLFGVNESNISADGKEFLKKFIQVYNSVVFSEKYENFVSTIMVEGHTDTTGSYETNLELSRTRASRVKNYCLTKNCGVEQVYLTALKNMLQSVGYSYDKPIYDEAGNVDMAASRRVSFRFIINLEAQG